MAGNKGKKKNSLNYDIRCIRKGLELSGHTVLVLHVRTFAHPSHTDGHTHIQIETFLYSIDKEKENSANKRGQFNNFVFIGANEMVPILTKTIS